jgi:hypothetical protein
MNDNDYLWDKTGAPDPEVQQLEELLGTLRYQPRPLKIPAGLQAGRDRSFFRKLAPRLAIAATIVMLLLGLGLWLGLQRLQRNPAPQIVKSGKAPTANPRSGDPSPIVNPNQAATPAPNQNQDTASNGDGPERIEAPRRHRVNQSLAAGNSYRNRNAALRTPQLATAKQAEQQKAEAAKDQLMLALRVASAKFGFAQRKAQGLNQKDQVHNQHKTG